MVYLISVVTQFLGPSLVTSRNPHNGGILSRGPAKVVGGGGGSWECHVARLNLKRLVSVFSKCFTSLSEIERKFFVFVGILEKGYSDAL